MGCREIDSTDTELVGEPEGAGVKLPAPSPTRCRVTIDLEIEGAAASARAVVEYLLNVQPLQRLINRPAREPYGPLRVTSALVSKVEEL